MITDAEFTRRAHEVVMEILVGELLLRIGFTLMGFNVGRLEWADPQMAAARRMMEYRWN